MAFIRDALEIFASKMSSGPAKRLVPTGIPEMGELSPYFAATIVLANGDAWCYIFIMAISPAG